MAGADDADLPEGLWQRYVPRARRQLRRLVRKHRDRIERVAAVLLERGKLTGEELDALH